MVGCVHTVLLNMDLVNWTCAHHIPKDHLLPFSQLQTENSQLLRVSPTPFLLPVQLPAGSCGIQAPFPSSGSRAAGTLWHVSPVLWHWRSWLYWKGENSPALQRCLKCLNRFWVQCLILAGWLAVSEMSLASSCR